MKNFTKFEILGLSVIFLILIAISVPNFIVSLRRSRDQIRRDDMGAVQKALENYQTGFAGFPLSSAEGNILACKKSGTAARIDEKGRLLVNLVPCVWGKDAFTDLTPGSTQVYLKTLPQDPQFSKNITYKYFSDGSSYQFLVSLEGKDEPEYDAKIASRGISCGSRLCNAGRSVGCSLYKTIEECAKERKGK